VLFLDRLHAAYPMLFAAEFKEKVWGGRRLKSWFDNMPPGPTPIGEAWVLSAHPSGPTRVTNGRLAGRTLAELCPEFPLLIKVLSCDADLSVQVHPPDNYAHLRAGESGKSEVWLVLEAAPGASIIHGLAEGVTPDTLKHSLASAIAADVMSCFRRVPVAAGDLIAVPPGTVHALGAGLVVAEVQQSSDTTYRLWDYGRLGIDGRPRELHVEQAMDVASYSRPPAITRPFRSPLPARSRSSSGPIPRSSSAVSRASMCGAACARVHGIALDRPTLSGPPSCFPVAAHSNGTMTRAPSAPVRASPFAPARVYSCLPHARATPYIATTASWGCSR